MYRHDGNLIAVRKVNSFQCCVAITKGVNGLVGEITDSDETYASKFG